MHRDAPAVPSAGPWMAGRRIAAMLTSAGHEVYAVGGCVRDLLLGRAIKDVDLATSASPDEVENIAAAAGLSSVPVGKSFGVIIVIVEGTSIEVASFRADGVYIDGRRPSTVVATTAQGDVERRDFTVNALLLNLEDGSIRDFVGGLADLHEQCLRAVGDAAQRFREDRLRILRALRLAAQLGFRIEAATWTAMTTTTLGTLARERVMQEWTKAMSGPGRGAWLRLSLRSGRLQDWFDPARERGTHADEDLAAALDRLPNDAPPVIGQALLLAAFPEHQAWLAAQPLPRSDLEALRWLVQILHDLQILVEPVSRYRTLQAGRAEWIPVLLRAGCPTTPDLDQIAAWCADPRARSDWKPCLSAKELLAAGWSAGPRLGQVLRGLGDAELAGTIVGRDQAWAWLAAQR